MHCDLISISELGERDLAAWQHLADRALSPNPFAEPKYVWPAVRAWGAGDVAVLAVRDGGDWLAALPVRHQRSYRGVPGRCLAAWRHSYCYLGSPLVAPEDHEASLRTLIAGGIRAGRTLVLDWVDADGPLLQPMMAALESVSSPVVYDRFDRAALYRRADGAYLEQTLSSSRRAEYRRKRRRLEDQVGPLALRDESQDPAAVQRFLAMESSGWKGRAGTAMATRGHDAFLTEVAAGFAAAGRLRLLSLSNDDHTVAMVCDLEAGDTSFGLKVAFDERLRSYGPGVQLLFDYVQHFHDGTLARLDSCATSDNAFVNRLLPGRRPLQSIAASSRGPAGLARAAKWRAAERTLPLRRRLESHFGTDVDPTARE